MYQMSVTRPGLRHQVRPGLQAWLDTRLSAVKTIAKPMVVGRKPHTVVSTELAIRPMSSGNILTLRTLFGGKR